VRRALTLIRHGLTDWNVAGRFQGQTDRPLSEEGRRQARRLARRTARFGPIDRVVASPLRRARETAELAFPEHAIVTDARLMELDFGVFEGGTAEENRRRDEWTAWYADPFLSAAPGGESYRDLRDRAVAWFEELPGDLGHVVAVTHSGTIQMLLAHVLGVEHPRWRKRIYVRHSSVSRIVMRDGEIVVERVNDTRHLDENGADPFWE
jgi:broad specificity phosphatase PhoE